MLKARGAVRLPGSPVAGEGMNVISAGCASVMSLAATGASVPWMAFLRLNASAAVWSWPTVFSLSRAET